MSTTATNPNRRAVLGAVAATTLLCGTSPAISSADVGSAGDARLQELVGLLEIAEGRARRAQKTLDLHERYDKPAEDACSSAFERCEELRAEIAKCPSSSMRGIVTKARCVGVDVDWSCEIDDGSNESLAMSIVRDLLSVGRQYSLL